MSREKIVGLTAFLFFAVLTYWVAPMWRELAYMAPEHKGYDTKILAAVFLSLIDCAFVAIIIMACYYDICGYGKIQEKRPRKKGGETDKVV